MKRFRLKIEKLWLLSACLYLVLSVVSIKAQSTNIDFPTPVTTNEINGKITARDFGDSRLTTHYYYFNGKQGDIFIKILTTNLDGDIDIFIADTLKPVTKISVFSDNNTETGREIYLRKPEKLLLRIEGRTPSDLPANYLIKFEGSFLAVTNQKSVNETSAPVVKSETDSNIKVNSVGTIIQTPPKKTVPAKTTIAKTTVAKTTPKPVKTPKPVSTVEEKNVESSENNNKKEVVVTENLANEEDAKKVETKTETAKNNKATTPKKKNTPVRKTTPAKKVTTPPTEATTAKTKSAKVPAKPTAAEELRKALENVNLVILFKDGTKVERPMNDVLRFTVDKGILTVVSKDGSIARYSLLDITKTTIE